MLPKRCPPLEHGDRLLVISHDCDVAHGFQDLVQRDNPVAHQRALQNEPYVEVIVARPANESSALLERGRNPRRLQLDLHTHDRGKLRFELHQRDKGLINRELLKSNSPDESFVALKYDDASLRILRSWLAKRYTRPAFPNALDSRLKPAADIVKHKLRGDLGRAITAIFLRPHAFDELPPGEPYKLIARIVARTVDHHACNAAGIITGALLSCADIELIEDSRVPGNVVSEEQFTFAEFQSMWPWDFDYLSALGS